MHSRKMPERVKKIIIGLVLSVLLSYAIFLATALIMNVVFYHDQDGKRDFTPVNIMTAIYFQISFWICFTSKNSDDLKQFKKETFSWKEDLKDTLSGDGLIIIIIVFILAVINEVSIILYTKYAEIPAQNPFALCVYPIFALAQCTAITNIPIVRTLIAYIETVPLMILQIVIQHKRDFEKWKH